MAASDEKWAALPLPRILYGYGVRNGAESGFVVDIGTSGHPNQLTFDPTPQLTSERWRKLAGWAERADADLRARFPWHESLPEVRDWHSRIQGH